MSPLVSIILRTKNEASTLARVLEKIGIQTEQSYELIVVDSGSTDETLQIARRYHAKMICISPESFHYGRALNLGIEKSRGEIAVSLSGHSIPYDRYWLANLLREFDDPRVAGTSCKQIPYRSHPLPWYRLLKETAYHVLPGERRILVRFLFENACSALRVRVWQAVPFDDTIAACEDHLWARQVSHLGYRVTFAPTSRVIHSHNFSSGAGLRRGLREMFALWRIYLDS